MNCQQVQDQHMAERYISGQLSGPESEAYEAHYFSCDACNQELSILLAARGALREITAVRKEDPAEKHRPMQETVPASPWRMRLAWAAGIGVAIAAASLLWQGSTTTQPSESFRGAADDTARRFEAAMQAYTAGDYAAAIPMLQQAVQSNPGSSQARFYLAACQLLTGNTDQAIAQARIVAATGETFAEAAHYLIGKAELAKRNPQAAREAFEQVLKLHGDLEAEAGSILKQMDRLPAQQTPISQ